MHHGRWSKIRSLSLQEVARAELTGVLLVAEAPRIVFIGTKRSRVDSVVLRQHCLLGNFPLLTSSNLDVPRRYRGRDESMSVTRIVSQY